MFDFELRLFLRHLASVEPLDKEPLDFAEAIGCRIDEGADRNDRETRVELHRSYGIARRSANESAFEQRVSDRFMGADETRAELNPGGAHFEIGEDCLAATDAARDEYGHLSEVRQHFLGEHRSRNRPDMATRLMTLDDDRVSAHADQLLRQHEGGGKAQPAGPAVADALDSRRAWDAAGEHHMTDAPAYAHIDQL